MSTDESTNPLCERSLAFKSIFDEETTLEFLGYASAIRGQPDDEIQRRITAAGDCRNDMEFADSARQFVDAVSLFPELVLWIVVRADFEALVINLGDIHGVGVFNRNRCQQAVDLANLIGDRIPGLAADPSSGLDVTGLICILTEEDAEDFGVMASAYVHRIVRHPELQGRLLASLGIQRTREVLYWLIENDVLAGAFTASSTERQAEDACTVEMPPGRPRHDRIRPFRMIKRVVLGGALGACSGFVAEVLEASYGNEVFDTIQAYTQRVAEFIARDQPGVS